MFRNEASGGIILWFAALDSVLDIGGDAVLLECGPNVLCHILRSERLRYLFVCFVAHYICLCSHNTTSASLILCLRSCLLLDCCISLSLFPSTGLFCILPDLSTIVFYFSLSFPISCSNMCIIILLSSLPSAIRFRVAYNRDSRKKNGLHETRQEV